MIIDTEQSSPDFLYKLLIGSVLPRPIAWVSTRSKTGLANLAPFSFFTVASCNPPILCFAPALKIVEANGQLIGVPKDSLRNIKDTGQFVVNVVSKALAEKMSATSAEFAPDVSEFAQVGLDEAPCQFVEAPRVRQSLINMECTLHQILEFGNHPGAGNLVLGRIVCIHIDDSVYKDGRIDLDVLQPIGRLAGSAYCTIENRFNIARP
jgi:flavin reductase (DIM6/NTAB) family NADH-FMN oxidoreductase RutF